MYLGLLFKSALKVILLQSILVFVFTGITHSEIKYTLPTIRIGIHPVYRLDNGNVEKGVIKVDKMNRRI